MKCNVLKKAFFACLFSCVCMNIFSFPALAATTELISVFQDTNGFGGRVLSTFDENGGGYSTFLEANIDPLPEGGAFQSTPTSDDGTFTINVPSFMTGKGIVSPDRNTLLVGYFDEDYSQLSFAIKKSSGMSKAKLSGQYIVVDKNTDGEGARIDCSFDGKGGGTATKLETNGDELGTYSIIYDISSDGALTFTIPGFFTGHGIVSADGSIATIFVNGDGWCEIAIMIKKSSGMSNANLEGEYLFASQNTDGGGYQLLATLDGNGNGTYQHLDSTYGTLYNGTLTYKVKTNGMYILTVPGVFTANGIVSGDGNIATYIYFDGDFSEMAVGIKKSSDTDADGDGYTLSGGDCDDTDATIYPGAVEIPDDGIDQDCDGEDEISVPPPSPPTGVAASDGTFTGKVQVTWTPASGAASYDVYRADMPAWAGASPTRIAASVSGNSYDDTSAANGSRYYYWVKSRNSGGVSKFSNFDPGYWGAVGAIPSRPTGVSATDGTLSGKVKITWTIVSNALVYEIWRADIPAYLGGAMYKIGTSTTGSYADDLVETGNQYYYWIKARNSWGVTSYSAFDTGYTGAASSVLPAPTGVSASDGTEAGKVKINWNAVSGAMVYEIWRATSLVSEGGSPVRVGHTTETSYNDATAIRGTTYYYWIKARDSWGCSSYSVPDTGYVD